MDLRNLRMDILAAVYSIGESRPYLGGIFVISAPQKYVIDRQEEKDK